MSEIKKRIITSVVLLTILISMIFYKFILIISLIIGSSLIWIEFNGLIIKIYKKKHLQNIILKFLFRFISLLYLFLFSTLIYYSLSLPNNENLKLFSIYILCVCIATDIGGLVIGKTFKGKKLTKISPNKTISGLLGSYIFSLILMIFYYFFISSLDFLFLIIFTLFVSTCSQLGDLFISLLKRKSKVKDTSNILPGHGGLLDRLDGILFGYTFGFLFAGVLW